MRRIIAIALWLLALPALAQQPATVDRARLESRLAAVGVLIEKSTAAKQIDASGDTRAAAQRQRAREVHRQAQRAFDAGDLQRASVLLPEASMLMFEAVRLAAPEKVMAEKARNDFDSRRESVRSLLAAQRRIAAEKPDMPGAKEASRTVERLLAEAQALAETDNLAQARARLDEAYLAAKASISSMRTGDTLVRTLKFDSKEDEYHYEVDRNDTHRMLVQLLIENKRGADANVGRAVERAAGLRSQADSAAARGAHVEAIKLLEDSTGELVRAIRNAGIYIPG